MAENEACNSGESEPENGVLENENFGQIMSRDRYIHILRCLHFHNNEEIVNHPLVKIKSVIGHVESEILAVLTPGKNLCIDVTLL